MTFAIWNDRTKKVVHRSVVRSADPNRGGIPNLRRPHEEPEEEEAEIVDPENILDDPQVLCPPPEKQSSHRTNKHKTKVKFHDAVEDHFYDTKQPASKQFPDFGPKLTPDDLPQSHPERRKRLSRSGKTLRLMTASACLSLAAAHQGPVIDSGENIFALGETPLHTHVLKI